MSRYPNQINSQTPALEQFIHSSLHATEKEIFAQKTKETLSCPTNSEKKRRRRPTALFESGQPTSSSSSPTQPVTDPSLVLSNPIACLKQQSELAGEEGQSLIAIIGLALSMQVKENSQFYSTEFQQATMSMQTAVAFAPLIYHNVVSKYSNQAEQTGVQATSSLWQAIVNFGTTGLMVTVGVMEFVKSPPPEKPTINAQNQTEEDVGNQLKDNNDPSASEEGTSTAKNINNDLDKIDSNSSKLSRKLSSAKGSVGEKMKQLLEILDGVSKKAQILTPLSEGASKIVDNNFKNKEMPLINAAGQADAAAQEMEQFAQFYNQSFNRAEDLRGGSQNNIDTTLQILKSISDTMTQTSKSIFRG